ncbi:MAG: TRAP transporter substrate-binding protein DctP [Roseovarius sp.]|nr:TRAP transporter substrate-binding protein DctP [Roseovarius sp.]
MSGIGDGLSDTGFLVPQYFPTEMPRITMLTDLLMLNEHEVPAAGAFLETMLLDCGEPCMEEMERNNINILATHAASPYNILCRDEIGSVEDLKGLKFRSAGDAMSRAVQAWGGIPVNFSSGEVYEGLQRGQIDCAVAPKSWLLLYGLVDVVKFIYDLPIGAGVGMGIFTINNDTWEDLPRDQKEIILRELPQLVANVVIDGYGGEDAKADEAASVKGINIANPPADLVALIDNLRGTEPVAVAAKARERGVENPEELIEAYTQNLAEWGEATKDMHKDSEGFAKLLWDRVYSRLVEAL